MFSNKTVMLRANLGQYCPLYQHNVLVLTTHVSPDSSALRIRRNHPNTLPILRRSSIVSFHRPFTSLYSVRPHLFDLPRNVSPVVAALAGVNYWTGFEELGRLVRSPCLRSVRRAYERDSAGHLKRERLSNGDDAGSGSVEISEQEIVIQSVTETIVRILVADDVPLLTRYVLSLATFLCRETNFAR